MDAPVTGSSPKAEDGTLTIMAGGSPAAFERARPLFEAMGELIVHVGEVGQGQLVKVINNAVAAANTAVVAEALLAGKLAGADLDALVTVMRAGSGASAMLELKAGPMRAHDWSTLFKLEHMLKDLRLCLKRQRRWAPGWSWWRTPPSCSPRPSEGARGAGLRRAARGGRGALGRAALVSR